MSLEKHLAAVARNYGLGELDFRDNRYHLTVENRFEITCFQANGRFYIHGVLARLPDSQSEQEVLMRRLLEKTAGLSVTERVVLSIDPEQSTLVLHTVGSVQDLSDTLFEETLARFISNFEYYLKLVGKDGVAVPAGPVMIMP